MTINKESIRTYIENLIFDELEAYAERGYQDLRPLTVVASESYDGNVKDRKDIIVVLKFLTAQNTNDVVDMPIQILVDVRAELQDIFSEMLQDIALTKNQKVESFKDSNNAVIFKFKQFFNTPMLLGTFQNSGAYKTSTLTMEARFVIFQNFATLSDMHLDMTLIVGDDNDTESELMEDDDTEIKEFKNTILDTTFHIEHRFDGRVKKGQPLQENKYNSYNISFTVSYILDPTCVIQQYLWENAARRRAASISYAGSSAFETTKDFNCYIQSYTETVLVSDVTKVTVTFVSGA